MLLCTFLPCYVTLYSPTMLYYRVLSYHEGAIPLLRIYSGAVFPPFLKETLTTLPNPIYQSWPKPILTYLIPPTPPSLINLTFPAYLAQPDLYYLPFTTKPTQPYILTHGFGVGSKEGHKTEKWQSNHLLSLNTGKSKRFIQSCLIGNKPSICSDSCDDFNINKHK